MVFDPTLNSKTATAAWTAYVWFPTLFEHSSVG